MKTVRWIAVLPAGLAAALLVMFPIHWLIVIIADFGDNPLFSLLSERAVENLANAFTTPFFIIYIGALIAPAYKNQTAVALAIITALISGGLYVLAFTGGPMFSGWSSLYYGATPVLNLAGIATALYTIWHRYRPNESQ
jgi:hypothetical protein